MGFKYDGKRLVCFGCSSTTKEEAESIAARIVAEHNLCAGLSHDDIVLLYASRQADQEKIQQLQSQLSAFKKLEEWANKQLNWYRSNGYYLTIWEKEHDRELAAILKEIKESRG